MATPQQEIINLDFEAFPPSDEDIPGIVRLLKQLFGGNEPNINIGQLAETFVSQNYVGCVLKQAESVEPGDSDDDAMDDGAEDTVYAFTSALNLNPKTGVTPNICLSQLKTYLKEKAKGSAAESSFNSVMDRSGSSSIVGLIINERFVNLPSEASVPMLESTVKDMETSFKNGMQYSFSHYIMISKMYRLIDPPKTLNYVYPEDELWELLEVEKEVVAEFDYQMSTEMDTILVDFGNKSKPVTATLWRRVRLITSATLMKLIEIFKQGCK